MALLSAILLIPAVAWSQSEVVQIFDNGSINWSKGEVTAVGIGAPPENPANMAQARMLAKRAALLDARRNLLEITQGVQVDSMTVVKNAIVKSDIIRSSVQGFVHNCQVIDTAYMSDGSIEVTVLMRLKGGFANAILPPGGTVKPSPGAPVYTGLVVDARGLHIKPAMNPKILDETGKEVYGSSTASRAYAVEQGMVGYAKDLVAAEANGRVTDKPLTVKALRASGQSNTDVVIAASDAQKMLGTQANMSSLQKCRVMIVVD
jgi:hypothetical protein